MMFNQIKSLIKVRNQIFPLIIEIRNELNISHSYVNIEIKKDTF